MSLDGLQPTTRRWSRTSARATAVCWNGAASNLSGVPSLNDLVDLIHGWYPPATADDWDAVGLVYGDPPPRSRR